MPTVKIHNTNGEVVGELELADAVFGIEPKPHLHWEVVRAQLAARRQGTHAVKTRATVSGSTKKTYRQKGTGNARHGSTKAPTFVGVVSLTARSRAATPSTCPRRFVARRSAPRCRPASPTASSWLSISSR